MTNFVFSPNKYTKAVLPIMESINFKNLNGFLDVSEIDMNAAFITVSKFCAKINVFLIKTKEIKSIMPVSFYHSPLNGVGQQL